MTQTVAFSQYESQGTAKFIKSKNKKSDSKEKAAVSGTCGNDTVRYAGNKAYYLQAGFTDPNTGGWSVNKQTAATNIVTTAFKVPTGGSVSVIGAEIDAMMMLTAYGAISSPTVSTHKVYLYTVDANNKPLVKIDSTTIDFTENFASQTANFIHGPHTLTNDFAIGVKGGATSDPTHFLYVAYNQMHVSTDVTNPYGEHLSFKYQAGAGDFIDMATNFGDATFDFEFSINPIVTYNYGVDFTQSLPTSCIAANNELTNTSTGTEIFESHSFSLSAFASRYNVTEGTGAMELPRDSIYNWTTGIGTNFSTNSKAPFSFLTQSTAGSYNDTLFVVSLTHNFNYCVDVQIISYSILDCAGLEESTLTNYSVSPNPSNDKFTVSLNDFNAENGVITFVSAEGKVIEKRNISTNSIETFDVKALNPGIYFFQIGSSVEKVIVQ